MSAYPTVLGSTAEPAAGARRRAPAVDDPFRALMARIAKYWWVELAGGVAWVVQVVPPFDVVMTVVPSP